MVYHAFVSFEMYGYPSQMSMMDNHKSPDCGLISSDIKVIDLHKFVGHFSLINALSFIHSLLNLFLDLCSFILLETLKLV